MKQFSLTNFQARILSNNIESAEKGFTKNDLRMLDAVQDIIIDATKEYHDTVEGILLRYRNLVRRATAAKDVNEVTALSARQTIEIEDANEKLGKRKATLLFEDAQYEFIKAHWNEKDALPGGRETRNDFFAVEDAVANPETAKIEDGKVVPMRKKKDEDSGSA